MNYTNVNMILGQRTCNRRWKRLEERMEDTWKRDIDTVDRYKLE